MPKREVISKNKWRRSTKLRVAAHLDSWFAPSSSANVHSDWVAGAI